jgi:hypothetical protein
MPQTEDGDMMPNDQVSAGFKTRLEYVLDQAFADVPDGGSHEMRKCVAERLVAAAQAGERSVDGLLAVAHQARASFSVALPTASPFPTALAPGRA